MPEVKSNTKIDDNILVQLIRYVFVGAAAFVADAGALWLVSDLLHIHYLIAAAVAFIFGLFVNYVLSKLFVFKQQKESKVKEFIAYGIIGVIGLGLTEVLMFLFTEAAGIHYMLSKVISAVIVLMWNFAARKFILYRR